MKVLILAGGYATRLWPLTEKRAKPLLMINGKTILAHIIEKIPTAYDIAILTNKKFEVDFQKEINQFSEKKIEIFCEDSFSDKQKKGALGAISMFLEETDTHENLLVCAGDNILTDLDIESLKCDENSAHIVVREVGSHFEARKFGVVELEAKTLHPKVTSYTLQKVASFEEKPEHPKSKTVMTGFLSLGKNLLPILHSYAEKSPDALGGIFIELLHRNKSVWAHTVKGDWFDVGSFETYLEAHKKLQKEKLKKGNNVKISDNIFTGNVYIGEGSQIKNCRITDTIIYQQCDLEDCHISNAIIDEHCDLKGLDINQKLIRKGTTLHNI